MNKALKRKWIAALTSGRFKQVAERLKGVERDADDKAYTGYCCLGVLRTIMYPTSRAIADNGDTELLCAKHEKEAGLDRNTQEKLGDMNDNGKSFAQIAKYIQTRL